jgi:hypothetical protein
MNRLFSDTLWDQIRTLASAAQPKAAAVAYVSSDAIVAFGAGDTLVTDATDEAIRSGQTSARILRAAVSRGAAVYSCPNLHAKVIVLGNTVVVGSCNLSSRSAEVLSEAAWVTDDAAAVTAATNYVQGLARQSVRVDSSFIARILQIPVRPRPRAPDRPRLPSRPEVVLVFFKEAMRGDLKKYARRSAKAQTGGGAMDLRVSPVEVYRAPLQQILADPGPELNVTQGEVYWQSGQVIHHATVELRPPTRARPLELRFARWWLVDAWDIPLATFRSERAARRRLFYVLELDAEGTAWARIVRQADLSAEDPAVAAHVRARIQATRSGRAAVGLVDLSTGRTLPV